jgi:hypothetical protein
MLSYLTEKKMSRKNKIQNHNNIITMITSNLLAIMVRTIMGMVVIKRDILMSRLIGRKTIISIHKLLHLKRKKISCGRMSGMLSTRL